MLVHMLRKGLKKLQKCYAQCQRAPNAGNVHDLRRAIRHVRSLLDVFREWPKSGQWQGLHERIRQLQHALGPIRDHHVRIGALEVLVKQYPRLAPLLRRARKEEREERKAVAELLAKTDTELVASVRRRLRRLAPEGRPRLAMDRTIAAQYQELRSRWQAMRAGNPRSMHRARVALRRLTHLLNTMAPYLPVQAGAALPALKRTQERLGRAHDMQMLLDWTGAVLMKLPPASRAPVVAFLDRSLHLLERRLAAFMRAHPGPGI